MVGLAELGEDAEGGFRVEEGDPFVAGTYEGDFVDEARALLLGVGELAGDVVRGEGDVVDAGAVFLQEFGDRAVGGSWLQELQMDLPCSKKRGLYLLGFDLLAALTFQPQDVFIIGNGFFD